MPYAIVGLCLIDRMEKHVEILEKIIPRLLYLQRHWIMELTKEENQRDATQKITINATMLTEQILGNDCNQTDKRFIQKKIKLESVKITFDNDALPSLRITLKSLLTNDKRENWIKEQLKHDINQVCFHSQTEKCLTAEQVRNKLLYPIQSHKDALSFHYNENNLKPRTVSKYLEELRTDQHQQQFFEALGEWLDIIQG